MLFQHNCSQSSRSFESMLQCKPVTKNSYFFNEITKKNSSDKCMIGNNSAQCETGHLVFFFICRWTNVGLVFSLELV